MARSWMKHVLASGALVAGVFLGVYAAGPALGSGQVAEIPLKTQAVALNKSDPGADRVGRLRYLGGLVLSSSDLRFGGISDLRYDPACGRFLAVTDTGAWVILDPQEDEGRLTGIKTAWMAPILDAAGAPPASKTMGDAESLARTSDGDHWVFYEQVHRAERFHGVSACEPASLGTVPSEQRTFPSTAGWPANGGMEAATALGQSLLVISEAMPASDGGRAGFQQTGAQAAKPFKWVPPEGHEPTAMDLITDGAGEQRLLVLHRRFSPFTGVSAVLSEARITNPVAQVVVGQEVARLAPPYTVDNMEGIATRTEAGRQYVYLVSDDNFNRLQRTILMKFELLPEP